MTASFETIVHDVTRCERQTVVVAAAAEDDVLIATTQARKHNLARFIYIGDFKQIQHLAWKHRLNLAGIDILDEADPGQAALTALSLIKQGRAHILMKGKIGTGQLLGTLLKDEELKALHPDQFLSHVTVFIWEDRWKIFSDAALTILPDIEQKRRITLNALHVARQLGIQKPRIAMLSAAEKVNAKMPSSTDAAELAKMAWDGAIVGGPLAFDGAMFAKAYQIKGVPSPIEGKADVLICPNIESANVLYKTLSWMFQQDMAGVITGGAVPCILTSRADSARVKFLSIAMTVYLAANRTRSSETDSMAQMS
jgi:phosphate butyryltransferase